MVYFEIMNLNRFIIKNYLTLATDKENHTFITRPHQYSSFNSLQTPIISFHKYIGHKQTKIQPDKMCKIINTFTQANKRAANLGFL